MSLGHLGSCAAPQVSVARRLVAVVVMILIQGSGLLLSCFRPGVAKWLPWTSLSPRLLLGCPFCMCLQRRSMLGRDADECLRKRHRVTLLCLGLGLGDRQFRCFPLAHVSQREKYHG